MTDSRTRTAGIIIIGNEILSGKVQDANSSFLAVELRALGVNLVRISVIPDDVEIIGKETAGFSAAYDYVFTSGGVGPTHDDVTMEGIAGGFGVKIIRHPELVKHLMSYCGGKANDAILKMAEVPDGAEIIDPGNAGFPIICFRNVFIFPGIPQYLTKKFSAIRERFRCSPFYLKRLFLSARESDIAEVLNSVVAENMEVTFGSYPILDNPEYKIIVTAESRSPESVTNSVNDLLKRLPEEIIVRVETDDRR
ncbi:MAG TPA: competence/damage-inducible protein A [Thermodesulfovibrionales bacterium]|nr:competence/damage-inducible protein A [Thermodesulfovibrionales bacterium]